MARKTTHTAIANRVQRSATAAMPKPKPRPALNRVLQAAATKRK